MNALNINPAFEAAVTEFCVDAVRKGAVMSKDLMITAMHAVIQRQYSLLDNTDAVRAVCDAVHAATADGVPARRNELSPAAAAILCATELARFTKGR